MRLKERSYTMEKGINKQAAAVGLAFFAALFGAGNLIFPSYMGLESGKVIIGFVMFIILDAVFSALGLVAESKRPEQKMSTLVRCGKPMFIFTTIMGQFIGFLCIVPRTCATCFEIGIKPLFPGIPTVAFSIAFFALTFVMAVKPGKVVDIVGKYLTPALIVLILIIVVKGLITPLGQMASEPQIDNLFAEGVIQGYQTTDAMGAPTLAIVYLVGCYAAGYSDNKDVSKIFVRGGIIACICMVVIYGGLFILGAQLSQEFAPTDITSTALVSVIVERLLGRVGLAIFALVVLLACLTTAISSSSGGSQYWMMLTKDKVKYHILVAAYCIVGVIMSMMGVNQILAIAGPFLSLCFPPFLVLIVLTLFTNKIKNDNVFIAGSYGALVFAIIQDFTPLGAMLPLSSLSLGWVIPAAICAAVGAFIPSKVCRDPVWAEKLGMEHTKGIA